LPDRLRPPRRNNNWCLINARDELYQTAGDANMANSISTASAESVEQEIPLEQRTDVTVDELEKLSISAELYDGKVVFKINTFAHGVIQAHIGTEIGNYLDSHRIGLVGSNANYRLWPENNRESRAPDVSFILKERLPKDLFCFPRMAPDLAVEILSFDDSFEDMMGKVDEYLSQGAKLVWVVITRTRQVLVCNAQSKYIVRDKLTAPELLPGFELAVPDIFVGL